MYFAYLQIGTSMKLKNERNILNFTIMKYDIYNTKKL
jgi:hypothetical protein